MTAALLFALTLALGPAPAPAPAAAPAPTVDDLAWLSGDWLGENDGMTMEESWSRARGGTMVGRARESKGGKVRLIELGLIEMEDGKPVLRIAHFRAALVGLEERGKAVTFRFKSAGPKTITFETDTQESLTYTRVDENTLHIRGRFKRGDAFIEPLYRYTREGA